MRRLGQKNFTEDKRCLILADFIEGVPVAIIAERYGCVLSYPSTLARREGYKRARSKRSKEHWAKKKADREKRDWLHVAKKWHQARERKNKRDWLHV